MTADRHFIFLIRVDGDQTQVFHCRIVTWRDTVAVGNKETSVRHEGVGVRQDTFFCADDYRYYIQLMAEWCGKCRVTIWAYCLMPNYVDLIAVPESEDGLRRAIGEAHRRYTRHINSGRNGKVIYGRDALRLS